MDDNYYEYLILFVSKTQFGSAAPAQFFKTIHVLTILFLFTVMKTVVFPKYL